MSNHGVASLTAPHMAGFALALHVFADGQAAIAINVLQAMKEHNAMFVLQAMNIFLNSVA